ncbi:hypothetical protein PMI07_005083 [Rhizobium sp. CF080]|nr:hypothetical protein [Rhizobium sp. CF080]EUB98802.1 hypothetical protein PMI07_005083 [Rhizobium sp. CF080]
MRAFIAFVVASLLLPAKFVFRKKAPDQPLTPEKLIRKGAGN